MESSTSIKFTAPSAGKLTLVFGESGKNVKINGKKNASDSNCIVTVDVAAGSVEITKGDTMNLFYMIYTPSGTSETTHTHKYESKITKQATCTEAGVLTYTCTSTTGTCDKKTYTETIPAKGHSFSTEWTVDVEATETTPGSKSHHCTVCDAKTDVTVIPATGTVEKPLTITASKTEADKTVTFTAEAAGGKEGYTYKFIVYNKTTGTWGLVQNYSSKNICTWTKGSAGDRYFYVDVKDAAGNVVRSEALNVKIEATAPKVTLTGSSETVNAGAKLTLTAQTTLGSGCTYKFIIFNPATNQWFKLQDFSSSNTFTWTAGSDGTRLFYVDVKDADGNVTRSKALNVTIGNGSANWLSVKATVSSNTSKTGDKITFTAEGVGGFASCKSLKSVVIPSTVTRVTDSYVAGAFENCTGLTSVTFKEGIAEAVIGQDSFNGCQSLLSVIIPGNYGKIGDSAFRNCTSLKSFKYAQSVNNIEHTVGSSAFRDCKSLTSITLEKGLKTIDSYAFCNTNVDKLDVPEGVTQIAAASFMDCKNLASVNIPSTVSSIGGAYYGGAFESCAKLTAVNIAGNKNIEASIGYSAFKDCVMLKNIVIPGNYNSIGEYAFSGCSSLTGFEYKKSSYDFANQNIGSHAFYQCIKLNDVKLPTTLGTIGSYAFYGCSVLQKAVIPDGVKTIGNNSFEGCKALETVTVPSTVESISRACFEGCTRLKNVIIAKGDTDAKISSYAFQDCTSLTDISVPGNYVNVDSYAFSGCTNLSKFSWEKGMYGYNNQSLSGYVFDNNNNLSVASLPSTLGTIDKNSFYNVKSTFVIEGETGSEAESYAKTKGITFRKYSQPLSINAVISPSGSAKDGDVINIQANASGGSLDYLYKLVVYNEDTGKWGIVRDYGETSGFTWASSTGNRKFYVKVKDSTGKEVLSPALISINKKLEAKASYKYVNNNIEFTALANYGSGNYQYKFIVYNVDTGKWGIIQDYSSKNTCVWNASGASAGNRKFYVDIKDSNGTVARSAAMNVSTQTGLNVSLKSSAAQVNPGASVKLTANATGGNGSYQYKFIVYNTATKQWGKVQDYSSSNTCTWIAGAAGTRQFYVDVKDASGKVVRSAVNTVNVGNGMSVTATISTNANKVGGKVTISGAATGGAGSYQYKFIVYNKTTKTWGLVQNFSMNNKITWTAGSAGDREFYIDVKDADGKVVRSSVMNVKTSK